MAKSRRNPQVPARKAALLQQQDSRRGGDKALTPGYRYFIAGQEFPAIGRGSL